VSSPRRPPRAVRARTILLPLAVFIILGASDLASWRHGSIASRDLAREQSDHLAEHIALHLRASLEERASDLAVLAAQVADEAPARRSARFTTEAERLLEREGTFAAVAYVADGHVLQVPVSSANASAIDLASLPAWPALRDATLSSRAPRVSWDAGPHGAGVLAVACPLPSSTGMRSAAVVSGAVPGSAILTPAFRGSMPSGFRFAVSLGPTPLAVGEAPDLPEGPEIEALAASFMLDVFGSEIAVAVWPEPGSALAAAEVNMRRRSVIGLAVTAAVAVLLGLTLAGVDRARRHAAELRESEERYRLLAENAGSMIYRISVPDGRYEFVSPASKTVLGYTPEEFYAKPLLIRDLVHPEWSDFVRAKWAKLVSGDVDPVYEYQIVDKSGDVRWIRDRVTSMRGPGGRPVAVEGVVSDITDLKAAEIESRRERDLVTRIVQTSPAAIVVLDRDGRITLANTLAEQVLSLSAAEIAGKRYDSPDWRITDYGGRPFPREQLPFERVRRTGRAVFGVRHALETEGRRRLLLVNAAPYHDEEGALDGMVATIEDVTDRVKDEKRIRESEARYRELFRHMKSGVAVYEARNEGQDFVFRDLNDAAERIESIAREDVIGRNVVDVFPGVVEFGLLDVMRRVWKTGRSERHPIKEYADERIVGWRENHVYKLPSGEIVAVYDDVTERMQAIEATRLSEERYRALVENSNDIAYATDAEGIILYVSPQALRYGIDPHAITGRRIVDLVHPDDRERVAEEYARTIANGEEFPSTFRVLGPGKRVYWFEDCGKVQRDVEGTVTGLVGILRDVTGRGRAAPAEEI